MKRSDIKHTRVVIKSHHEREAYENEKYYYLNYKDFTPELIGWNDETKILIIEECTPLTKATHLMSYRQPVWDLLQRLHEAGANHRDAHAENVVIKNKRPLLIDFEAGTEDIGQVSSDLYGCVKTGVKPFYTQDNGAEGAYWDMNTKKSLARLFGERRG